MASNSGVVTKIKFKAEGENEILEAGSAVRTQSDVLDEMMKAQLGVGNDVVVVKKVSTFGLKKVLEWCELLAKPIPTERNAKERRDRAIMSWLFALMDSSKPVDIFDVAVAGHGFRLQELTDGCVTMLGYRSKNDNTTSARDVYSALLNLLSIASMKEQPTDGRQPRKNPFFLPPSKTMFPKVQGGEISALDELKIFDEDE